MALSLTFDPILVHLLHVRSSGCIHRHCLKVGRVVRHGYEISITGAIVQVAKVSDRQDVIASRSLMQVAVNQKLSQATCYISKATK